MAGREAVQIDLTLNELDAKRGLQSIEARSKKTFRSFERDTRRGVRAGGRFSAMLGGMTSRLVAMGAAYLTVATAKKAVAAFIEQEKSVARLNAALKVQGTVSRAISKDMQDYASWLQSVTTFGDEATIANMALAVSMGATSDQAKQLATAAADMSVALDMSFSEATMQLSRTLSGEIGRLGMIMPELKKLSRADLRGGGAIGVAQSKFGGMAQDLALTEGGKLQQSLNAFGDQMEKIGNVILPPVVKGFETMFGAYNTAIGDQGQAKQMRFFLPLLFGMPPGNYEALNGMFGFEKSTPVKAQTPAGLSGDRVAEADRQREKQRVEEVQRLNDLLDKMNVAGMPPGVSDRTLANPNAAGRSFTDLVDRLDPAKAKAFMTEIATPLEAVAPQLRELDKLIELMTTHEGIYSQVFGVEERGMPGRLQDLRSGLERDAKLAQFQAQSPIVHQFSQDLGGGIRQSVGDAIHEGLNGGNAIEAFSQSLAESATQALTAALTEALIGDALQDLLDGIGMAAAGVE